MKTVLIKSSQKKWLCLSAFLMVMPVWADNPETQVLNYLVKEKVLPAHSHWQQASSDFQKTVESFCKKKTSLAGTQEAWRNAQHAWVALQPSLVDVNARNTIGMQASFWPDKRNLVGKQTEAALASGQTLSLDTLKAGSVVLRGLTTSEYLLFDAQHKPDEPARRASLCPLLQLNTTYQSELSSQIVSLLKQDKVEENLTQLPNAQYADAHSALTDLLRTHVTALAVTKKKMSVIANQGDAAAVQLFQAEAWRAGDTLNSLQASIVASRAQWDGKGWRSLLVERNAELANRVDAAYAALLQKLSAQKTKLETLLSTAEGRQQVDALYADLNTLHLLYEKEVAKALGIHLGFNGTDGD